MNRLYLLLYSIVWPFFNLVHPNKVIGRENIPNDGVVICANHTRNSDPLYVVFAFGKKHLLHFMAKAEMSRWPVVGPILSKLGLIWVKRGRADIGAIKSALKVLKGKQKLLIFPEGTRYEEMGEGKTGAVMLAIRAKVPILPVYLPAKKKWFRCTPVVIGQPYHPFTEDRRATTEDYRAATEDLMARIAVLGETIR